jgi:hypothetical protein
MDGELSSEDCIEMNQLLLDQIIEQADELTVEEQLALIERLARKAQRRRHHTATRRWRDIRGMAAYPLLGEDAQTWVSRIRQ